MPESVLPIIREARLGKAPPNSTIRFTIPKNGGYLVEATMSLGTKTVAAWQSTEILGKTTEELLLPAGLYTLQVDVIFNKQEVADVTLEFSIHSGGKQLNRDTTRFTGKNPDIGRAFAMVRIKKP